MSGTIITNERTRRQQHPQAIRRARLEPLSGRDGSGAVVVMFTTATHLGVTPILNTWLELEAFDRE